MKVPMNVQLVGERKVFIVCRQGHVDEVKPPGFVAVREENGQQVATNLCRLCYYEFMTQTFPALAVDVRSREEATSMAMKMAGDFKDALARAMREEGVVDEVS